MFVKVNSGIFSNNELKTQEGSVINMNLYTYKFIGFGFQFVIEENIMGSKKLYHSKIVNNYESLDSIFLDKSGDIYKNGIKTIFNYESLQTIKSIKSNPKLILFLENNNNEFLKISCSISNFESLKNIFGGNSENNYRLETKSIEKYNRIFYILNPIEIDTTFKSIYEKNVIDKFIEKYNEKYILNELKQKDLIKVTNEETNEEIKQNNYFSFDEDRAGVIINGIRYEIYDGQILSISEINMIEKYKEDVLYK